MLMPASSEFVEVCQAQIALLTQGLGAVLCIIYITEELTDVADAKLVPVVTYPEEITSWGEEQILSLLMRGRSKDRVKPRLISAKIDSLPSNLAIASNQVFVLGNPTPDSAIIADATPNFASYGDRDAVVDPVLSSATHPTTDPKTDPMADTVAEPLQAAEQALLRQQQIILPLIHEGMVMGLLVTARADRPWNETEQQQLTKVADTVALACVLDQRAQWLAQDVRQQKVLREQKRDIFDDLLHQFRNPLTAVRTFGKLLTKRLQPGEPNREVAEGIVRESDRLQEMLKELNAVIDLDETKLLPASTAPTSITEWEAHIEEGLMEGTLSAVAMPQLSSSSFLTGAPLKLEPHHLSEVLVPLLNSAEAIAQDRQLVLHSFMPTDFPPVLVDLPALREVLSNLIDNALKYTPSGGHLFVLVQPQLLNQSQLLDSADSMATGAVERMEQQTTAETTRRCAAKDSVTLLIADTGCGIPPQDLERLFERHYRGVQATTGIPGTGLGLAIARDLLTQMRGEILISSPAQTCGLIPPSETRWFSQEYPGTAVVVKLQEADSTVLSTE